MKYVTKFFSKIIILLTILIFFNTELIFCQSTNYSPLFTNGTFTKTIDTSLPVGTIGGKSDAVSGAANYTIPIVIPPGTNGIQPSLAIAYSSFGSDGILGKGWSLSGLSVISRIPHNIYFDGETEPVELSTHDRFALDGQRLIGKTGNYGNNGATYGAEMEDFTTVTSHGSYGGGPSWFEVETKDGVVMEYGNSNDSKSTNSSNSTVIYWRLNKIIYKDGNYIEFSYENNALSWGKESLIDEIRYTGNTAANLQPYNRIHFYYTNKMDVNTTYEADNGLINRKLLDKIVIQYEGQNHFKTYEFKYGHNNISSYLKEMIERGSDNVALNSTIFKYGDEPMSFSYTLSNIGQGQRVDLFSGDFDGDGVSDVLAAEYAYHNNGSLKYHTGFKIYKRPSYDSPYALVYTETFDEGDLWQLVRDEDTPKGHVFYTTDFTGDGRDDLMINKLSHTSSGGYLVESFNLYRSEFTSSNFTFNKITRPPYYSQNCTGNFRVFSAQDGDGQYFYVGDFDGDGTSDYMTILSNGLGYKVLLSFPEKNIYDQEVTSVYTAGGCYIHPQGIWFHSDYRTVIEFDGDGRQELMLTKGTETKIFTFKESGGNWMAEEKYSAGFPTQYHLLYLGDFNGDL